MLLLSNDESCRKQHEIVRNTAGWYYYTHQLIEVSGKDACTLLDRIYVSSIAKLAPTRGRYTMYLNEDGIPEDDCVIFRVSEDTYWISTIHCRRQLQTLAQYSEGLDVSFNKITKDWEMYAVQGPKAEEMVKSFLAEDPAPLKRFQIVDNKIGDMSVKVAKSSYTGENGYEIYCYAQDQMKLEQILEEAAAKVGAGKVDEFDVIAYSLPTEVGYYLITDLDDATPFETGMDWMIDWSKESFPGKAAVIRAKAQPKQKELVSITVDEPFTKVHGGPYGAPVFKDGVQIGRVTKFTFGYSVNKWVGFALIKAGSAKPGDEVILNWEDKAVVIEKPIYKK